MKTALKMLAIMTFMLIIVSSLPDNIAPAFSTSQGGKLDIFTQKEPFSGRGLNMSSDAFGPEEKVIIYASVTYNDDPVGAALVAFEVHGPENSVYNITLFASNQTDDSGIAKISFRIGLMNQINFGEWKVFGSVYLADKVCLDFLSFKVGWIVEVVSIKTVNESYVEQTEFTKGSYVGIELSLRNIAMTEKKATLLITVYDPLKVQINSTEIKDCNLQPNGSISFVDCFLSIPEWACTGDAVVYASAYSAPVSHGGIPYCPEISKHFWIAYHNIAILSVKTSSALVYKGETVNVSVTVKNWGQEIESFNVNAYYNETNLIDAFYVSNLEPNAEVNVVFVWNTSCVEEGSYQISAYAEPVPSETYFSDNLYVNGFVEVSTKPPRVIHDVAVLTVCPYSNFTYVGEVLEIFVIVKNEGNATESFDVTVLYDLHIVETLLVENLEPGSQKTLVFQWNTQNVAEGNYTLRARANKVPGEENLENNSYDDGIVSVVKAPAGWFVPCWFYWLLLLLLVPIIILLIVGYYRRKRRKRAEEAFYSGWTAWYYGRNMRKRTSKT